MTQITPALDVLAPADDEHGIMTDNNDSAYGAQTTTNPPVTVPPLLAAENLHKSYGPARALAGVSFAALPGESVAIMGASGSGKTTLLHVLAGIIVPDAGTVTFQSIAGAVRVSELGEKERSRLRRESFGFVFQQGLLLPELTANENVALPLMMAGYPRREAEGRATHWLHLMGLSGLEARRIGELSGGQAQRVAIARAQVTGATVTFADEPTGALDSTTGDGVMSALLDSTVGQGNTLIVVTHDETVAARCSRTIRMQDGMLQQPAPAQGVASQGAAQQHPHTSLGAQHAQTQFLGDGWSQQ